MRSLWRDAVQEEVPAGDTHNPMIDFLPVVADGGFFREGRACLQQQRSRAHRRIVDADGCAFAFALRDDGSDELRDSGRRDGDRCFSIGRKHFDLSRISSAARGWIHFGKIKRRERFKNGFQYVFPLVLGWRQRLQSFFHIVKDAVSSGDREGHSPKRLCELVRRQKSVACAIQQQWERPIPFQIWMAVRKEFVRDETERDLFADLHVAKFPHGLDGGLERTFPFCFRLVLHSVIASRSSVPSGSSLRRIETTPCIICSACCVSRYA